MRLRRLVTGTVTVLLVGMILVLAIGQLLGQPLLFGFVTTGSMEPALSPGDGFIAVPPMLAGEPTAGDVVVYEAETIQDGGLTTHRIVGETEQGYVTKGDANPFTDQDGGEPYVTDDEIVAYALQINGEVVAIPYFGTAVTGLRSAIATPFSLLGTGQAGTIMVFGGMLLMVIAGAMGGVTRDTSRSRSREDVFTAWVVVLLAAMVVTTTATLAMVVPASGHDIEVVVTESPTSDSQVVEPGETASVSYDLHNSGVIPALVITDSVDERATVTPEHAVLGFNGQQRVIVRMDSPQETGEYTYSVRESRYLLVLPVGVLGVLHSIHPLVALLAVDLVVALFIVTIGIAVFGTGYFRVRSSPAIPLKVRIRRKLRRLW
jgi:signal peptidase